MCLQEPEQPSIPDQPPKSMGQLGSRMAFVGDGLNAKSINNCLGLVQLRFAIGTVIMLLMKNTMRCYRQFLMLRLLG